MTYCLPIRYKANTSKSMISDKINIDLGVSSLISDDRAQTFIK